jgi:hypothetical protein
MKVKKSLNQQLQKIVDDYTEEFEVDEIDLDEVAEWAVKTGRYQRKTITIAKQCKRELARVLRTEHFHDPQGREPRKWHPVRIKSGDEQLVLWMEFAKAKPNHMRISLQQRRQGIYGRVRQHKTDLDSYNDNNSFKVTLPLFDYDFNKDLEEGSLPTEYPDAGGDQGDDTIH